MNREQALEEIIKTMGTDEQKELLTEVNSFMPQQTDPTNKKLGYCEKLQKKQEIMSIKDTKARQQAISENIEVFQ